MPHYNVLIKKRSYKVELVKTEEKGQFRAKINGKPVELKLGNGAKPTGSFTIKIAEKVYRIELGKIESRSPFTLRVNTVPFEAQLLESPRKVEPHPLPVQPLVAKASRSRARIGGEGTVVAPMAGKIVSVKVRKGDVVKSGDVVCVLEAMKMENEITATKAGRAQEVNVVEGTPVNEGDVLVTIA
jgi:biotin carboxyl carrier protein